MSGLHQLLHDNPEYALVAYMTFMAAVQSLPTPKENSRWYAWLYNTVNLLSVNLGLVGKRQK